MTAASIAAARGARYARYLESKTLAPERGDYYLQPSGEPTQAPGRWLTGTETRAALGLPPGAVVGADFVALMEGRHPRDGVWLRRAGADGRRGGGIDLTFSAPKSVSVAWALGDAATRAAVEEAHGAAVRAAVAHAVAAVPVVRRRRGGVLLEERALDLVAAEYRHTTARAPLSGELPDPQLHSHVVIMGAVRVDRRIVAIASRPLFRAARELGAFYRSSLATELRRPGFPIESGTGRHGRYFEIAGIPRELLAAFSARSDEVAAAAERFRARWGRAPDDRELRRLKLEHRRAKRPLTSGDLERAWRRTADEHGFSDLTATVATRNAPAGECALEDRIETCLTERAATFLPGEFRAVALEQSVGRLAPGEALALTRSMLAERRVLELDAGVMTTRTVRERERGIERRISALAAAGGRDVGAGVREAAAGLVAGRIGAPLSAEQREALGTLTGPERVAVLVGPAGTGKGVVIDAAALAEQAVGNATWGVAVAGSTAQRLGQDCPALHGSTLTVDALVLRSERDTLPLQARASVFFDEAGMADTARLYALTTVVERAGAKLVLVGDAAQLPSIGAGGMFARLASSAPTATLSDVRRTCDRGEQRAWADLRAGRADRALAHYRSRGRLHVADTREQAIERAVAAWATLTVEHPVSEVALISDASNVEIHRLNARAQQHRLQRGELGEREATLPGVHYGVRRGDRVAFVAQHREPGRPRVENGSSGQIVDVTDGTRVVVAHDATGERWTLVGEDLAKLRLGYAHHIHRAQGATVDRALVVTGGWQTSKEPAYVQASRARHGTDWFVNRDELGAEGNDSDRIERLASQMRRSHAQVPSLAHREPPRDRPARVRAQDRGRVRSGIAARARDLVGAGRESDRPR